MGFECGDGRIASTICDCCEEVPKGLRYATRSLGTERRTREHAHAH